MGEDVGSELAGVRPGEILAGKYRVERVLGAGGMGVVVAARHIELDSPVALKFLLPSLLSNQEAVARFAREARAAVSIQSEHVARVLDVGTLETGAPYMVMEFLDGGDLETWIKQRGPLPIDQAVDFVLQACVAVADAHGLGIIHRDLKPANLFCIRRTDGQFVIKVIDFGISKLTSSARGSEPPGVAATRLGAMMGSPLYMSPEQLQSSKDVDFRTDVWALGIILFELLTGTVPFRGVEFAEVAIKIATRPPPALSSFRPDVPAALESVVYRCLEKSRERRFANVAELARALFPFAPLRARALVDRIQGIIESTGLSASALGLPEVSRGREGAATEETLVAPQTDAPWAKSRILGQRRARVVVSSIVAVGVLGGIAATVAFRKHPVDVQPASRPVAEQQPPALLGSDGGQASPAVAIESATTESLTAPPVPSAPPVASELSAKSAPSWESMRSPPNPVPAAPRKSLSASPISKANCDPPYTLDEQGQKHFKHECFPK